MIDSLAPVVAAGLAPGPTRWELFVLLVIL